MRWSIILGTVLCASFMVQSQTTGTKQAAEIKHKYPPLHHALRALHHAHEELKESTDEFGGHKHKAEKAIHAAIKNIDAILRHEKDEPIEAPGKRHLTEAHKRYTHHPYLYHAIHEVHLAETLLKESKEEFGGHKVRALHDMEHAVVEIEMLLKHAREHQEKK